MVVDISCPPDGHIRPLKTEADQNSLGQKIGGPETSDGSTPKKPNLNLDQSKTTTHENLE